MTEQFNQSTFLDNLKQAGIREEQARAHAKAVEDALQRDNPIALFAVLAKIKFFGDSS